MDHAARRAKLASRLDELGVDAFLLTGLPNVRYLTGFSGSNGQLILARDGGLFLTDGRYEEQSRREVPDLPRTIYRQFPPAFAEGCREVGAARVAFEAPDVSYQLYQELSGTGVDLHPAGGEVELLRAVKDREEVASIGAAQEIADEAFDRLTAKLVQGITEKQAALELDTFMRESGADGLSFDTIMAFGESAAEPHHQPTGRPLARGELVKMDFGCVVGGYHSDMTRTVAFGQPPERMGEVYEAVRRAQQAGVDAVRPGVTGSELDGLVRGLIEDAGYGEAFKHPLGHGVGLEIHEAPWLRSSYGEPLPEGAVVTVEPGIYLDGVGGVRIEDMVEVTAEGGRVIPRVTKELVVL